MAAWGCWLSANDLDAKHHRGLAGRRALALRQQFSDLAHPDGVYAARTLALRQRGRRDLRRCARTGQLRQRGYLIPGGVSVWSVALAHQTKTIQ